MSMVRRGIAKEGRTVNAFLALAVMHPVGHDSPVQ